MRAPRQQRWVVLIVVIALVRALAIQDFTPGEKLSTDAEHRPLPATLDWAGILYTNEKDDCDLGFRIGVLTALTQPQVYRSSPNKAPSPRTISPFLTTTHTHGSWNTWVLTTLTLSQNYPFRPNSTTGTETLEFWPQCLWHSHTFIGSSSTEPQGLKHLSSDHSVCDTVTGLSFKPK